MAEAEAILRRNGADDFFSVLGSSEPSTFPQQYDLLMLRMKRTLADIVHDFDRPFLDYYIDINMLINQLLTALSGPSQADRDTLRQFYTYCTNDAQAKKQFKREKQIYMAKYNIPEATTTEYSLKNDDEDGDITVLWESLFGTGSEQLHWYIDAQIGNPIKNYEKWRAITKGSAVNNIKCLDPAIESDPATKWGGEPYLVEEKRNKQLNYPGNIIGVGYNYSLTPKPDGTMDGQWYNKTGVALPPGPRNITAYNNSIDALKSQIASSSDPQIRIFLLLSKTHGDADQGYTVSSTLWESPIYVTNDILECEDKDMYNTGRMLLSGPTTVTYYNYGVTPQTHLTEVESNIVREVIGPALTEARIDALVKPYIGAVNNFFKSIRYGIATNKAMRFKYINLPADAVRNGMITHNVNEVTREQTINDDNRIYTVSLQKPDDINILANITGTIITLIEKAYLFEIMNEKIEELYDLETPGPGELPISYKPFVSQVSLAHYLGLYNFFKSNVIQREINKIFARDYLKFDTKHILYNELVYLFRKFVTAPDIPIHTICLFIVAVFLQSTMPVVPLREGRGGKMAELTLEKQKREDWLARFYSSPRLYMFFSIIATEVINGTVLDNATGLSYKFIQGTFNELPPLELPATATFHDIILDMLKNPDNRYSISYEPSLKLELHSFRIFIEKLIRICFLSPPFDTHVPLVPPITDINDESLSEFNVSISSIPTSASLDQDGSMSDDTLPIFTSKSKPMGKVSFVPGIRVKKRPVTTQSHIPKVLNAKIKEFNKELNDIFNETIPRADKVRKLKRLLDTYEALTQPVLGAALAQNNRKEDIKEYFRFSTRKVTVRIAPPVKKTMGQRGGGDEDGSDEEIDIPTDVNAYMDMLGKVNRNIPDSMRAYMEALGYLDSLGDTEIDIFTFQDLVSTLVNATIGINTDPDAHLIYAMAAVAEFSELDTPDSILKGFEELKENDYISNGIWKTVPGWDTLDEVASAFEAVASSGGFVQGPVNLTTMSNANLQRLSNVGIRANATAKNRNIGKRAREQLSIRGGRTQVRTQPATSGPGFPGYKPMRVTNLPQSPPASDTPLVYVTANRGGPLRQRGGTRKRKYKKTRKSKTTLAARRRRTIRRRK